jgi:hypothetical protein
MHFLLLVSNVFSLFHPFHFSKKGQFSVYFTVVIVPSVVVSSVVVVVVGRRSWLGLVGWIKN